MEAITIDEYIAAQGEDVQGILREIRRIVKESAPEATERICMRIPTFDMHGKWLVHFAAFKKHIGFYPQPEGVTAFADKLTGYKTSKGSIQFPLNKPIPYDLIAEITQFRATELVKENV